MADLGRLPRGSDLWVGSRRLRETFFPERSGGEQPRQKDQYAQKYSGMMMMSVAYIENCMGQALKDPC